MPDPRDGEVTVDCAGARKAYQHFKDTNDAPNEALRQAGISDGQRNRILGRSHETCDGVKQRMELDYVNVTRWNLTKFAEICDVPLATLIALKPRGNEKIADPHVPKLNKGPNRNTGGKKPREEQASKGTPLTVIEVVIRISTLLEKSNVAVEKLERAFQLPSHNAIIKKRADELATKLERSEVQYTVEKLTDAYDELKSGSHDEQTAALIVKQVLRQFVLLVLDEAEVAQLRDGELRNGAAFIKIPAASETFAEIIEARLGKRTPRFAKAADPDDWPPGHNSIPIPPETFKKTGGGFSEAFDLFMFDKYIKHIEIGYSYTEKLSLANKRHNLEMKRKGRRYCVVDTYQSQLLESTDFETVLKGLQSNWPSVAFLKLTPDANRSDWETQLLWAARDILPEEA